MSSPTKILSLGTTIAGATAIVNTYFLENDLPVPSFDISGPSRISIPPNEHEVAKAYAEVLSATMELHNLMLGPTAVLMGISPVDSLSLHCIYAYKIAHAFPVGTEATFEDISEKCGLNLIDTRRILRHAMTNHIFQETRPGIVAHTAASKLLATDPLVSDFVGIGSEERFQAAAYTTQALQKFRYAKEPNQSVGRLFSFWSSVSTSISEGYSSNLLTIGIQGFSLGHQTTNGLYEELRSHPSRGHRWANAMSAYASKIPLAPLISTYDWASLGSAIVADVGGGYGPVSIGLAKSFQSLRFIVQDFADVVAEGPAHVPSEISSDRITFMPYDMLKPQTIREMEVLFFRAVLHNWTDHYCVQILRNQIPALKKGSRLVIVEPQFAGPGELSWFEEKRLRTMDLIMLSYFGSRERSVADWGGIFKEVDERFQLGKVASLADGASFLMEVLWTGE